MRTLTYQETDANARHVEAVEPMLDVKIDVPRVLTAFPLENTLRDRGHGRVMALLDSFKELGERAVVLAHFWGPFLDMRRVGIVPGQGLRGGEDECRREDGMSVLSCSERVSEPLAYRLSIGMRIFWLLPLLRAFPFLPFFGVETMPRPMLLLP